MYSVNRTRRIAGMLVALASGLAGAALAHRGPEYCECGLAPEPPPFVLPEVEVVASRLPKE